MHGETLKFEHVFVLAERLNYLCNRNAKELEYNRNGYM